MNKYPTDYWNSKTGKSTKENGNGFLMDGPDVFCTTSWWVLTLFVFILFLLFFSKYNFFCHQLSAHKRVVVQAAFIGAELSKMNCGSCYVLLYSINHRKCAFRSQRKHRPSTKIETFYEANAYSSIEHDLWGAEYNSKIPKKKNWNGPFFINFADFKNIYIDRFYLDYNLTFPVLITTVN